MVRVVEELRAGHNPLDEGGVATLLASPDQRDVFGRIGGLRSTMERLDADLAPARLNPA